MNGDTPDELERGRELASFGYDAQAREILEGLAAERDSVSLSVDSLALLAEQLAKVGSLDAAQGVAATLAERVDGGASVTDQEVERAGLARARVLVKSGRHREALDVVEGLARHGRVATAASEQAVSVLLMKAEAVLALEGPAEALVVLEDAHSVAATTSDAERPSALARADAAIARVLRRLGRMEQAVEALTAGLDGLAGRDVPDRPFIEFELRIMRAECERALGRSSESRNDLLAIQRTLDDDPRPRAQALVATARLSLAEVLVREGDAEQALEVLALVLDHAARHGDDGRLGQALVDRAGYLRGELLEQRGSVEDAIAVWRGLDGPDRDAATTSLWRLRALRATATALGRLGAGDDAIDAWRSLVGCPGELETGAQRHVVAQGWLHLASALDQAGRIDEEISALQALRQRFPADADRQVARLVAGARLPLAVALLASGRDADAEALTDELVSELGTAAGERLEDVAGDVVALSAAFAKHERYERAAQLCEAALVRIDALDEPWAPPVQVRARVRLGYAEARRGRLAEAMTAFESIFDVGEGALPVLTEMADKATGNNEQLNAYAAWALLIRGLLLAQLGRTEDARAEFANLSEQSSELRATPIGHAIAQMAEQAQAELDAEAGRDSAR